MLERTTHSNGVVTFRSPLLRAAGVKHAFSTRIGGVSTGPCASLNLGNPSPAEGGLKDSPENIQENFRRLLAALDCPALPRAWVTQVHGRRVERIAPEPDTEYAETLPAEIRDRYSGQLAADGLVSALPGILLTIRTADCVPVLLASDDGTVVAAVHAGWRGIVAGVLDQALRILQDAGIRPDRIVAAIGPAISAEHFEVGQEVAAEFTRAGWAAAVRPVTAGKPHVDLQAAIRLQLRHAGVTRIDGNDLCTFRDAPDFFSHRRDHAPTGRMAAVIAARA